jgi:hypothetical protein
MVNLLEVAASMWFLFWHGFWLASLGRRTSPRTSCSANLLKIHLHKLIDRTRQNILGDKLLQIDIRPECIPKIPPMLHHLPTLPRLKLAHPLRPNLIKHPTATIPTPYRLPPLQLHLSATKTSRLPFKQIILVAFEFGHVCATVFHGVAGYGT